MENNFRITFDVEVDKLSSVTQHAAFFTVTDADITSTPNIAGTLIAPTFTKDALPVLATANGIAGKIELIFYNLYKYILDRTMSQVTVDSDLEYATVTVSVSRVAGIYLSYLFVEGDNDSHLIFAAAEDEIQYGEMYVRGGGPYSGKPVYSGKVRNAFVQLGSFQDTLNEKFVKDE